MEGGLILLGIVIVVGLPVGALVLTIAALVLTVGALAVPSTLLVLPGLLRGLPALATLLALLGLRRGRPVRPALLRGLSALTALLALLGLRRGRPVGAALLLRRLALLLLPLRRFLLPRTALATFVATFLTRLSAFVAALLTRAIAIVIVAPATRFGHGHAGQSHRSQHRRDHAQPAKSVCVLDGHNRNSIPCAGHSADDSWIIAIRFALSAA